MAQSITWQATLGIRALRRDQGDDYRANRALDRDHQGDTGAARGSRECQGYRGGGRAGRPARAPQAKAARPVRVTPAPPARAEKQTAASSPPAPPLVD